MSNKMKMNARVCALLMVALCFFAMDSDAKKTEWTFTSANVVLSDGDAGTYVVRWKFPERLLKLRIEYATLEVRMDSTPWAEAKSPYIVRVSRIEDFSGANGTYRVIDGTSSTGFAVSTGTERLVVDVTSLVRSWQGHGGVVYGLVSSGDGGDTRPVLRTDAISPGAVAKLTVYGVER
ncbi:MAG: hypothetical protein IH969_06365 [Candidatus Krumholzibacteriota bacterium]|nr:hypothetical protein [Candidatus Krumholzibacteriota bacterium]